MGKEILTFGDIENEKKKKKLYQHKSLVPLREVNTEKELVCDKISFGQKTLNTLLVTFIMIIKLNHCI